MKPIPGFPDYCITEDGQVWSNIVNRFLKASVNSRGYLHVELFKNKKGHIRSIHRLVLRTYVGPCQDGLQCRHLNNNKEDNRLENLCWGTAKENGEDRAKAGVLKGEKNGLAKLTEQDVRMIIYMYRTGEFTMQEIANIYNVSKQKVWQIVHRKARKHIWNTGKGE